MKKLLLLSWLLGPLCASAPLAGAAAADGPPASPQATLRQSVGFGAIEVEYSRPGAKDRTMLGERLPYGKVWRTGANDATALTFSTSTKLNGNEIPAGTYYLFTIPGENEWIIILTQNLVPYGENGYLESQEFLRFAATPEKLTEHVETFTIDVNDIRDFSATLNLIWEHIRVPIRVELPETSPAAE